MGRRTCLEHRGDARQALGPCPVPAASGSTDASVSTTPGGPGQGRFPEHTGHTRPGPLDRVPVGVWVTSPGGTEGEPVSARRLLVVPVALVSALGLGACGAGAGSTAAGSGPRASAAAATTTSPAAAAPVSPASTPSADAIAALPTDERLLDLHNCQDPAFRQVYADFCNGGGAAALAAGHPMVAEGPVTNPGTSFVQYGDGLRVEIVSATKKPTAPGESYFDSDHPNFNEAVTVTIKLTNNGGDAIQLKDVGAEYPSGLNTQLLYGEDRYDATCWAATQAGGQDDFPQRLSPGHTASYQQPCTLPLSELGTLAVAFVRGVDYAGQQSGSPGCVFTDVQALLH